MRRPTAVTLFALCALTSTASAEQTPSTHGLVPVVQAVRATAAIVIDGQLNDEVWLRHPPPRSSPSASRTKANRRPKRTELRIAYDDTALYVGVRLNDREP